MRYPAEETAEKHQRILDHAAKLLRERGLSKVSVADVMKAAGTPEEDEVRLLLRAVDGYAAALTVVQARAQRFIVATHLDGQAMALGGLGPLWAIHDADRIAAVAALPLAERFASCPWALYHIGVEAG